MSIFVILIVLALVFAIVSLVADHSGTDSWGRIPWLAVSVFIICAALLIAR